MRRVTRQLEAIAQKTAVEKEREHFAARAIKSRKRRKQPLDADALAQEAIWFCERGTSYSDFIRARDPKGWDESVFGPFRAEVVRQLGAHEHVGGDQ
jgi:hypothetical protein